MNLRNNLFRINENCQMQEYSQEDKVLVAVDCIIFGFDQDELKVLLIKRGFEPEMGKWSLMGGFLKKNENLDEAATRVLNSLTGLDDIYMEQLYGFSKIDRDPAQRTISIAYFALINIADHNEELTRQFSAQWFSLADKHDLIFDHDKMVAKAIQQLRYKTTIQPIGFELLPEKFTMRQLQKLYEAILNQDLDKRNFSKKIIGLDLLVKLSEKEKGTSKKGSHLYRFDSSKYQAKLSEGFNFKL